ncbi:hypothetical protein FJTKL_12472 [Diaporthe vaccinii]|uniref:Uncharacterized protein n=1 Tax=Diaporthe vaccinii TaxID=105482 RepID=A0ABR4EDV5_9PEZI
MPPGHGCASHSVLYRTRFLLVVTLPALPYTTARKPLELNSHTLHRGLPKPRSAAPTSTLRPFSSAPGPPPWPPILSSNTRPASDTLPIQNRPLVAALNGPRPGFIQPKLSHSHASAPACPVLTLEITCVLQHSRLFSPKKVDSPSGVSNRPSTTSAASQI